MKIGFINLGCSKNLVETEMIIGLFKKNNDTIVSDVNEAEMIIINTCGFINSAKEEAISTILEMAEYKKNNCKYLVVMGCLVERYYEELKKLLPEVDLFIPINKYNSFWQEIERLRHSKNSVNYQLDYLERVITTGKTTTYLKIAEGCNNKCTYCAIPNIRGPFISRKMEDIIEEAKLLEQQGFKEIILIAQDTSKYGVDIYGKPYLAELLEELCKIQGFKWIRFLYTYPESIDKRLIEVVKNNEKICKYFDIPIQHISNSVLKRMNRKTTGEDIRNTIKQIRQAIPNVILRTSLIVGFPGETEEDFNELLAFVKEAEFDKLGVFEYSKEDGTPAEKLPNQIHYKTKQKRHREIMELATKISAEKLKKHIRKTYEVLIENITFDGKYYIGRTYMDIPDEDGVVIIKNTEENLVGKWVDCKITNVNDYDFIGEFIK